MRSHRRTGHDLLFMENLAKFAAPCADGGGCVAIWPNDVQVKCKFWTLGKFRLAIIVKIRDITRSYLICAYASAAAIGNDKQRTMADG